MSLIYHEALKSIAKKPWQLSRLLLNGWSIYRTSPRSYGLPLRVQLEQGTLCNLNCQMCPLSHIKRPKGVLTLTKFKKIYNQINPPFLNLTGLGEPFLNPDILKIVSYAKKHGSYVKFDTNGILVNKKISNQIIKSKLDMLSFSIDAADPKTYIKIRGADKFDFVMNNLKVLIKMRNLKKSPLKIHTATVVQKDNLKQLIKIIQLLDEIGVDQINTIYVAEHDVPKNKESLANQHIPQLKKIISEYYKIKDQLKTEVSIIPLEEHIRNKSKKKHVKNSCYLPWHSTYITWNGDVYPCCFYYDGQIKLGNVFQEDFKKIWNNSIHQNFRRNLIHHREKLPLCNKCEINEEYIAHKVSLFKEIPFINSLINLLNSQ